MTKDKPSPITDQPLLEAGQIWRMANTVLKVGMVGKTLVHYKLGKPNAIRTANSCSGIKTIQQYLKANNAVLA
jgi:hypothetical protein